MISSWVELGKRTTKSHMLPFFWGGDNDASFSATNGLPTVLTAGLNAGMSGISMWMSALGGYNKTARGDPDPVLFGHWTEYYFGPALLVAPALGPVIQLYVPEGDWIDYWSDDVMTLVPASEYADKQVKSMDNRRVWPTGYPSNSITQKARRCAGSSKIKAWTQ